MRKIEFNPLMPLYTTDAKGWRVDELPALLTQAYEKGKPVVFFVHGRGKEPNKSLRGGTFTRGLAAHKIERGYDATVIMFNWDSAFSGWQFLDRTRALGNTTNGANSFAAVLVGLRGYLQQNPRRARPSLLVHSMGSIVMQRLIETNQWGAPQVFENIIFSQPDADDVGHANWLNTLAQLEQVYVTLNHDDHVLKRSTDARPKDCCALGLGTTAPLALAAKYVDLSNMGPLGAKDEDHEVFSKGAMNGQLHVCNFFTEALLGRPVQLEVDVNVEAITRQVIYKLKQNHQPGAACLKIPSLEDFE